MTETKQCLNCGADITLPYELFCSEKCKLAAQATSRTFNNMTDHTTEQIVIDVEIGDSRESTMDSLISGIATATGRSKKEIEAEMTGRKDDKTGNNND